jgi:hypothetical protein
LVFISLDVLVLNHDVALGYSLHNYKNNTVGSCLGALGDSNPFSRPVALFMKDKIDFDTITKLGQCLLCSHPTVCCLGMSLCGFLPDWSFPMALITFFIGSLRNLSFG